MGCDYVKNNVFIVYYVYGSGQMLNYPWTRDVAA